VDDDGALFDSGFDGGEAFRDTPEPGSISLESALRDFGPAAIDDLIPRLRSLAVVLDAAHDAGVTHGALHPNKVFITDEATSLVKGTSSSAPYVAPEIGRGERSTPQSDQFALAAIAYEWMFGRPIDRPAERPIEVRTMPGVDRAALSKAFTRALAPKPGDRFASCMSFCDALTASIVPELPLIAPGSGRHDDIDPDRKPDHALRDQDEPFDTDAEDALLADGPDVDIKIVAEEANLTAAPFDSERDDAFPAQDRHPDIDAINPGAPKREAYVPNWNPAAAQVVRSGGAPSFGGFALILAAIVGSVFGFAAGYMARPRALQSGPPQTIASAPATENTVTSPAKEAPAEPAKVAAPSAPEPKAPAPKAVDAPKAAKAPETVGRLLVRSNPSGATVSVDGVEKGVTPLALRDLDMGTRNITVARRGFISESRKVLITNDRPSRSLDVRLTAQAAAAATPKPSTPATLGKPAASTGSLSIDSRPTGASVTINGKPSGTTPLTMNDLPPGEYRVLMSKTGFRNFATTVRVVAGERARAAASLTVQE
jgi:hypothetical protein